MNAREAREYGGESKCESERGGDNEIIR